MNVKKYLNIDVYEAFQRRMDFIFSEFENVTISFSGGKDSGLLLHLVMDFVRTHGITKRVGLFHQDMEAQYQCTTDFVTDMFEMYADSMEPYWWCIPIASRTAVGQHEMFWYPWDETKPEAWIRPRPDRPYIYTLENNPMGNFYRYRMEYKAHMKAFTRWYCHAHGGGRTIALMGMRADESLRRYQSIVNKRSDYKGKKWITQEHENSYSSSPLYDWTTEDIWHAHAVKGYPYNRVYDLFYLAGLTIHDMRVASPFHEAATASFHLYKVLEPETWTKLLCRVSGANFAALYGKSYAMGYRGLSLPDGYTWESYVAFLLASLPEYMRQNYIERFAKLDMNEPPWREMAICILKNDHLCRNLNGAKKRAEARVKQKAEWREGIFSKYADL